MDTITIVNEGVGLYTLSKSQLTFKCLKADLRSRFLLIKVNGVRYNSNFDFIIRNVHLINTICIFKSMSDNEMETSIRFKGGTDIRIPANKEFIDFINKVVR